MTTKNHNQHAFINCWEKRKRERERERQRDRERERFVQDIQSILETDDLFTIPKFYWSNVCVFLICNGL